MAFLFYHQDYQSKTTTPTTARPLEDTTPDYKLIKASEDSEYTNVEFYRNATSEDSKDVQFMVRVV